MNDAIIIFSMMGLILLMLGISLFMHGHKILAIGIFTYVFTCVSFTTLIMYDKYWWAALVMTIWAIISFPSIANKIGKRLERIL